MIVVFSGSPPLESRYGERIRKKGCSSTAGLDSDIMPTRVHQGHRTFGYEIDISGKTCLQVSMKRGDRVGLIKRAGERAGLSPLVNRIQQVPRQVQIVSVVQHQTFPSYCACDSGLDGLDRSFGLLFWAMSGSDRCLKVAKLLTKTRVRDSPWSCSPTGNIQIGIKDSVSFSYLSGLH
jgi:hypothetical protein